MVEQGTHKPLVGRSNRPVAIREPVDLLPGGAMMLWQTTRIITPVTWLAAPDWLTVHDASWLSGHSEDTIKWLIEEGDIDAELDGDAWLIEKVSLYEFQEALLEVWQLLYLRQIPGLRDLPLVEGSTGTLETF